MIQIPDAMMQNYLMRRRDDLIKLQSYLQDKKIIEIQDLGHRIVGSAKSFGFPELEEIALQFEDLNAIEDLNKVQSLVSKYKDWLLEHSIE